MARPRKNLDVLVGKRFGRLTAISEVELPIYNRRKFLFRCDCGVEKTISVKDVIRGTTVSCGCKHFEGKHLLSNHVLYKKYHGMLMRCYNRNDKSYKWYGAKGVGVCEEWRNNFMTYYNWALNNGWERGLEIDRYPNRNGDYGPNNCRWATETEQARNTSAVKCIEINGITQCISEWCEFFGFSQTMVRTRICRHPQKDAKSVLLSLAAKQLITI